VANFKTISVLGCGWLGFPLASRFVDQGFIVKGATTTALKMNALASKGIQPHLLSFPAAHDVGDFFNSDIAFINIPFRRNLTDPCLYHQQINGVIEEIIKGGCSKVIFASSTLVYPNGLNAREDEPLEPQGKRAQVLWQIEQDFLKNPAFESAIIRFAGLYGPDREIKNFLNRASLKEAEGRVNLIHLDDCLGIIEAVVEKQAYGQIFNAVSDGHPTREELYTKAAKAAGQAPPTLLTNPRPALKIVSNAKIKAVLQYALSHPDPLMDIV
jgi:hypothetical protein